jgi:hypothetical protein
MIPNKKGEGITAVWQMGSNVKLLLNPSLGQATKR